jgi:hypothetical protein
MLEDPWGRILHPKERDIACFTSCIPDIADLASFGSCLQSKVIFAKFPRGFESFENNLGKSGKTTWSKYLFV